jgi:hypothetical protein
MDTPRAIERLEAIIALVAREKTASAAQIAELVNLPPRMANMYVTYLCDILRLAVHTKHNSARRQTALYCLGTESGPLPVGDCKDASIVVQRSVGVNDWPRGEHAHRSGLLHALFPFARERTEEAA